MTVAWDPGWVLGSGVTQFSAKVQGVLELPGQWRRPMCKHPHATQAGHVRMGTGEGGSLLPGGRASRDAEKAKGKA